MKLMHKLTVKESSWKILSLSSSGGLVRVARVCVESFVARFPFLFCCLGFCVALRRYLKMRRAELSWSSLNEHLINHPYNASVALFAAASLAFFAFFSFPLVCRDPLVSFVIFKKIVFCVELFLLFTIQRTSYFVFFVVGRLLMAIKISQKINVLFVFVVPVQFLFFLCCSLAASFFLFLEINGMR